MKENCSSTAAFDLFLCRQPCRCQLALSKFLHVDQDKASDTIAAEMITYSTVALRFRIIVIRHLFPLNILFRNVFAVI